MADRLSLDQELDFVRAARAGSEAALNALLEHHAGRVDELAGRVRLRSGAYTRDDLCQEGMILLALVVKAKLRPVFDPGHGTRLWSFASRLVWHHLIRVAWKEEAAPRAVLEKRKRVREAHAAFRDAHRLTPTAEELAGEIQESPETVRLVLLLERGRKEPLGGAEEAALPPIEAHTAADLFRCLAYVLRDRVQARKALIVILLCEVGGITLPDLVLCYCPMGVEPAEDPRVCARAWPDLHAYHHLPAEIPETWEQVLDVFRSGPPDLATLRVPPPPSEADVRQSYETLRKYYLRLTQKLASDLRLRACQEA